MRVVECRSVHKQGGVVGPEFGRNRCIGGVFILGAFYHLLLEGMGCLWHLKFNEFIMTLYN